MDEQEILIAFNSIIRRVFFDPSISVTADSTAFDVDGWDSISHLRLIMELEKHFSIKFEDTEVTSAPDVGGLVKIIKNRIRDV